MRGLCEAVASAMGSGRVADVEIMRAGKDAMASVAIGVWEIRRARARAQERKSERSDGSE